MIAIFFVWWHRIVFVIGLIAINWLVGNPIGRLLADNSPSIERRVPSPDGSRVTIAVRSTYFTLRGSQCDMDIRVVKATEKLTQPEIAGYRIAKGDCETFDFNGPKEAVIQWVKPKTLRVTVATR